MGAWIETIVSQQATLTDRSHPTWVRGLKLADVVAMFEQIVSHPTWVRGLKPSYFNISRWFLGSHPTWVRGLKLYQQ